MTTEQYAVMITVAFFLENALYWIYHRGVQVEIRQQVKAKVSKWINDQLAQADELEKVKSELRVYKLADPNVREIKY